jgi:hypothetical protein
MRPLSIFTGCRASIITPNDPSKLACLLFRGRLSCLIFHCAQLSHSPAHPLARRDVPLAWARAFKFSPPLFRGVAEAALYCAHRATTVLSWGLCEQEGHLAAPRPFQACVFSVQVHPRARGGTGRCMITRPGPVWSWPCLVFIQNFHRGRRGPAS